MATRAPAFSADTAAARPEAPLPITSTSKWAGAATRAESYPSVANSTNKKRICLEQPVMAKFAVLIVNLDNGTVRRPSIEEEAHDAGRARRRAARSPGNRARVARGGERVRGVPDLLQRRPLLLLQQDDGGVARHGAAAAQAVVPAVDERRPLRPALRRVGARVRRPRGAASAAGAAPAPRRDPHGG